MNNSLMIFDFNKNKVRSFKKDDNSIWFVAKDVCDVLEIVNNRDAILKLDDDEKDDVGITDTIGRNQDMTIISESGLYSLVLTSRKKEAKNFKKWITSEVIPSIRKTGGYNLGIPKTLPDALRLYANELEQKEKLLIENEIMKPKVLIFDKFLDGSNFHDMGDVAKYLGTGRTRLFSILRNENILMKDNIPYQKYIDRGYFKVKNTSKDCDDKVINIAQTFVTAKGVEFISKLLDKSQPNKQLTLGY